MDVREKITDVLLEITSMVLQQDREYLAGHLDLDLITDLKIKSTQYFPIITALEDAFDIELPFNEFRSVARTISKAIDYVEKAVNSK